jgi:hypothetical protein
MKAEAPAKYLFQALARQPAWQNGQQFGMPVCKGRSLFQNSAIRPGSKYSADLRKKIFVSQ